MCMIAKREQNGGDGVVLDLECDHTNMECVM